ncbi:FAD binding domain protein [Aspergillus clavatus NRRL 1]|uniref:FAD binding domain protein n=1 Tax=Aspergillus clavatus (strain ATCC 1007 / CBS 513.65 / DSM 816 / NCTC 3887 / NRRL 1 / QM 1276 / 107) TaxID=344612 RepID=A1CUP9_ASPCL|nr:FAD binding domain protein [Aspergillus clavatus NRRL 1]EAW07036.1 FAD binding domain protein [Aspergillus clavatus NRRL 1]
MVEFIAQNRRLKGKVHALGGKKWLYAHAYYTEDEFWPLYNRSENDRLRDRYHASYLPGCIRTFAWIRLRTRIKGIEDGDPSRKLSGMSGL